MADLCGVRTQVARRLPSRRQVAKQLYNSPGGKGYAKVKLVGDQEGLLVGEREEEPILERVA